MQQQFVDCLEEVQAEGKRLNQHLPEFAAYLEFVRGYFDARNIMMPQVVEIGILDGAQKKFYESYLFARYTSIDIDPKAPADIHGDSRAPETLAKLKKLLDGEPIDLLFIDGLHTYEGVKADYEIYAPLCRHIVGLHDILTPRLHPHDPVDVIRFWEELKETNKTDTLITIQHHNPRPPKAFNGRPLGIGLVIKGQDE